MTYLLDANVFISAKRSHYGFDFCPGFWTWLIWANDQNRVSSIQPVRSELLAMEDDLADWVRTCADEFFLLPTPDVEASLNHVKEWVADQGYVLPAIARFFQAADGYLVAHAFARGCTLGTHEVRARSKKKIKIPDVCAGLGIKCVTPFAMLRRERARFILDPTSR